MRTGFDKELEKLNRDLTKMSNLVEVALENMITAFKHQDKALAKEIIENDHFINDMEKTIESRAFRLMLLQQPIASDLRDVTTATKIVTDLERIGDQAADIAENIIHVQEASYRTIEHIPTMAKKSQQMVHDAIDAFVNKDLERAKQIKKMDDDIDTLFEEVKQEVIEILKEDSEKADCCIEFLMIAKYLERIGDHAVNLCEWLEFNQTGILNEQRLI